MNDDLISREALKKSMRKSMNERYISWTKTITVADIATLIFDEIEYAPTVDIKPFASFSFDKDELNRIVEERVIEPIKNGELVVKTEERPQGEWQLHGMIYYCSECGHECGESGDNFCGNCGADMRVKDELNNELKEEKDNE